jgi:hypothetical protein
VGKIYCDCGGMISDSAMGSTYMAELLAEEDQPDLFGATRAKDASVSTLLLTTRNIYQCWDCGRLTLEDPLTREQLWFAPEQPHLHSALGSNEGSACEEAFTCDCTEVVSDVDDDPVHAGLLLAGQVQQRLWDAPRGRNVALSTLLSVARRIHQCRGCGRLALNDPVTGESLSFAPEQPHVRSALSSGATLYGRWRADEGEGELYWRGDEELPGGFERFPDQAKLERRFHALLEMLRARGRLQWAVLTDADAIAHEWRGAAAR